MKQKKITKPKIKILKQAAEKKGKKKKALHSTLIHSLYDAFRSL